MFHFAACLECEIASQQRLVSQKYVYREYRWGQPECGARPVSVCLDMRHIAEQGGDPEDGGISSCRYPLPRDQIRRLARITWSLVFAHPR